MLSRPGSVSASPLGSTSTAVCCASSTLNLSPADNGRGSFYKAYSYHGSLRRLTPAVGRARLTLPESATSCSCASSTCAIASESRRIAHGTWTTQLCAWFQQASVGGARGHVFASRAFVTVILAAHTRGGLWTQNVCEGKIDRVHPHGPLFPRQLVSHFRTHWITQEALLNMIDAIDTDMNARAGGAELIPWLPFLDCAPQHVAKEFRSIMRDTRSHIKLCYVQRNFTAYTQPLHRAYMRAFKSSVRREVAKHFAEFLLEAESNFERVNLDSSTSVLRQLLLSFVHTAAQNADSLQHRTAGWRFIERGGAARASHRSKTSSGDEKTVSTRHSRRASRARCRGPRHRQGARGARDGATGRRSQQRRRGYAHGCRGISGTSGYRCSKESSHESASEAASNPYHIRYQTTNVTASRFAHKKIVVRNPGRGTRVLAQRHQRALSCPCQSRGCTVFFSTTKMSTLVGSERVIICCCFLVHPYCPRTVVSMCLRVLRQFHRLHHERGQMTNVTAINVVSVFEEVCAGHSCVTEQMHMQGCSCW